MTKQEIAEFMAENVLGWTINEYGNWCNSQGCELPHIDSSSGKEPENFIYSPEGFFAVWDAISTGKLCKQYEVMEKTMGSIAHGKDRYQSFYNAVMEVWE
jgi:hypothetical protein